jgi:hypothetical protein
VATELSPKTEGGGSVAGASPAKLTFSRFWHPTNALVPIEVELLPKDNQSKRLWTNAPLPTEVTVAGMTRPRT